MSLQQMCICLVGKQFDRVLLGGALWVVNGMSIESVMNVKARAFMAFSQKFVSCELGSLEGRCKL